MSNQVKWSANFAYTVGLVTTDGNLSKDGRHLNLTSKDLQQIQNFAQILHLKNKISYKASSTNGEKIYLHLQFGNKNLYTFLQKIGLTPHKSKTLGALKIPRRFFRDFLRGHLDCDGSIITYEDKYNIYKGRVYSNLRVYIKFISASHEHILWLYRSINTILNLNGTYNIKRSSDPKRTPIWEIKFSKKESLKLINLLYYKPDLPSLDRKRDLALQILVLTGDEKRKIYTKIN